MKTLAPLFLLILTCLTLSPARALALGNVVGEGATTCQRYAGLPLDKKNKYVIWTQGYITAFNNLSGKSADVLGNRDYRWAVTWLDEYCAKNPPKYFVEAVMALTESLVQGKN